MESEETKSFQEVDEKTQENRKSSGLANAAFAAGGFVAGVAATVGVQSTAANIKEEAELPVTEASEVSTAATATDVPVTPEAAPAHSIPNPDDVILATDEGVRVAQVSDDQSFGEAFADARAQVGAGGVFEWHGKAYGTYYKEEWDGMSAAEHRQYQASIDYNDVLPRHSVRPDMAQHHAATPLSDEVEVKVLGVEEFEYEGNPMTVAAVEIGGEEVLFVDIDHDGDMDIAMADLNHDGAIGKGEIEDISNLHLQSADLEQHIEGSADVYAAADMNTYV
ncbi:MAG: hypothetical protein LBQ65_06710 [Tannerellaceae bacterium]|jgi:hypothetical protein|nr:hypothetical protein [Tannerellaceae bacterium]